MKKILYIAIVLVVIGAAVVLFKNYSSDDAQVDEGGETPTALISYFQERMVTLGIEDIGHPIEGFDANLLMLAFPGLTANDFAGVEAFEGHYEVIDGEMSFVRDAAQPISSAERTVAEEGYETLLENISARLNVVATSTDAIDALIVALNTGERIETRIDEGGSALGVRVIPHEVLEDSRCPIDVNCIQEGTVRVRATLESGLGTANQVFTLNEPITTEAETVTLVQVSPFPESGSGIEDVAYVFMFEVQKR